MRVAVGAVGQLARQRGTFQEALAAREIAGLAGRVAGPRRVDRLLYDGPRLWRVLLQELGQLGVDRGLDQGADLGVAELASWSGPRTAGCAA